MVNVKGEPVDKGGKCTMERKSPRPRTVTMITFRWHLFCSHSIIPGQQIHASTLSGDGYAPYATLTGSVCIPIASLEDTPGSGQLWTTEHTDDRVTTRMLSLLLRGQQTALQYPEKILFFYYSVFNPLSTYQ